MEQDKCTMFLLLLQLTSTHVSGQDKVYEATITEDFLYSPGYDVGLEYANNMTFDYRISTNYFNHSVTMTVTDCEMEADKNGDCLYDTLTLYDGYNSSDALLDVFCCANPSNLPSWTSSGSDVYLIFQSDGTNVGKGFKISFVSDGPTTTTTTTTSTTTSTRTTTTTTPTTTSTTTPTTSQAVVTASTAAPQTGQSSEDGNSNMTYIIAGVCAGVALIVIVIVIIVCLLMKSKTRPVTPFDSKSVFWRTQAKTRPVTAVQPSVPPKFPEPPGHVETNVFDVELPDGRGNLLPPLSSEFGTKTVES